MPSLSTLARLSYGVNAAFMQFQLHEWGIHIE
jgi:hypothetical protein